jgi:hypothetical protein
MAVEKNQNPGSRFGVILKMAKIIVESDFLRIRLFCIYADKVGGWSPKKPKVC